MSAPLPRYRSVNRDLRSSASLDEQLPANHQARIIWQFTLSLDFSDFDADVKAVQGRPGRPAYDPRLLFCLWLFALTDGVCLARELARRCRRDLPYQWLCGGLSPDYHTLSDFHACHKDRLSRLFVGHVAALREQGLIKLKRVAVDGAKRPGSAGNATYHREPTLSKHLQEAEEHLRAWEQAREAAAALTPRQRSARARALQQRAQRLRRAVEKVKQAQQERLQSKRKDARPEEARASEADPDAVRMKQGDGGFRIGYNVQTVTDAQSGLVAATGVTNQANDVGLLSAALGQLKQEQGASPEQVLLDSGYAAIEDVQRAEEGGVEVIMPPRDVKRDEEAGRDPYQAKRRDTEEVAAWRARMGTERAKALYRQRGGLAEIVHARMVQRRWRGFRLRWLAKAGAEALWQALAHNVQRLLALGRLVAGAMPRAEPA